MASSKGCVCKPHAKLLPLPSKHSSSAGILEDCAHQMSPFSFLQVGLIEYVISDVSS